MSERSAYGRLLQNGPLVRLLVGEFVSSIGDWLYLVALLIVVYDVAQDPVILGIVGAARIIPYVVLSIPAGIVADRFDRRLILLSTDVIRGVLMAIIAVLVATDAPVVWVVVLAVVATCASTFFGPAIAAYIPMVVGDERDLAPANSAWATLDSLAFVIGPGVAGVLVAMSGLTLGFALNAVTFGVIAVVLMTLPSHPRGLGPDPDAAPRAPTAATGATAGDSPAEAPAGSDRRAAGWRGIVRQAWQPMAIDLAASTAGGALSVLVVLISVDQVGGGDAGVGYLNAATGVGGVVAGIVGGILVLRRLDLPLALGAILGGFGLAVLGFTRDLGPALVVIGVALGGITLLDIVNVTLLQRLVPDDRRGRAVGILQTTATAGFIVGSFAGPILAGMIGLPAVLVVTGATLLVTGVAVLLIVRPTGILGRPDVSVGRIQILARSVFAGLPPARLEAAAQRLLPVTVEAGQVIIRQGDTPDRFYMIERGRLGVSQRDEDGVERTLRELGPGDVFGEIGLLRGVPRTATVTAVSEGSLFALEREPFLELVSTGPGLSSRLLDLHRGARSSPLD